MKTKRNILIAFILNTAFSIFELIGGILTGSVAITSDAVHDMGDALSIGIAYCLEQKSQQKPDAQYTYGYLRYSVLGGFITTMILLIGSVMVIYHAIERIVTPAAINYNGMILFAIAGVCINGLAVIFTRDGQSINQKTVNLHMLEDVLGWAIVLIGAIVMRFTGWSVLDPILSIGVAIFIFLQAMHNLKEIADIFLEKKPKEIDIETLKALIKTIEGVDEVHHIHLWSMDGINHYATMHIVAPKNIIETKEAIRKALEELHIHHVTIEIDESKSQCCNQVCPAPLSSHNIHTHHHHHH